MLSTFILGAVVGLFCYCLGFGTAAFASHEVNQALELMESKGRDDK